MFKVRNKNKKLWIFITNTLFRALIFLKQINYTERFVGNILAQIKTTNLFSINIVYHRKIKTQIIELIICSLIKVNFSHYTDVRPLSSFLVEHQVVHNS